MSSNDGKETGLRADVEDDPVKCKQKFHQVLDALLNRSFTINNDVYLEMIVSHLSGKYDNGEYSVRGL